jgi:hypothetical protein
MVVHFMPPLVALVIIKNVQVLNVMDNKHVRLIIVLDNDHHFLWANKLIVHLLVKVLILIIHVYQVSGKLNEFNIHSKYSRFLFEQAPSY